jgi:hypothetical protein
MSDHFSGPRAIAGPAGDICDLYAFPSPERAGHLVLVMNVRPRATPADAFSDAIVCRFRLRPLAVAGRAFAFGPEELVVDVAFDPPGSNGEQEGRCTTPSGEAAVPVDDEKGGAGRRSRTCCCRRRSTTRSTATWSCATSTTWRTPFT